MSVPALPFTTAIPSLMPPGDDATSRLLPATWRTREDNIVVAQPAPDFLRRELVAERLEDMHRWLWLAGRPMPPRPLHHQLVLGREVVVSEKIELHLVWTYQNRLFLKPLPRYLLDAGFWPVHLLADVDTRPRDHGRDERTPRLSVTAAAAAAAARGLLFSYTALVAYESDFRIARDKGLLPAELTWGDWQALSAEYLAGHSYASVSPRYWFGELRLSRLNKMAAWGRYGAFLRGYSRVASTSNYRDWISQHSAVLTTVVGYVVVVLTAMQVGLGTEHLQASGSFQDVSYGFTVFSMISPLIIGVLGLGFLLAMALSNWAATNSYRARRFKEMGIEPDALKNSHEQ